MSKSRRPAVQRYHDRVAGKYDHSYDDAYWLWHDALTWDYLKPFLPRDLSLPVLDLGCGTGKWALKLLKSGYRVTCIDISAQMLDQARQKLAQQGSLERAEFVQADLGDLTALPAGGFGAALALGDPIGCTDSPPRTLKQIRRLLVPGGTLIATFDNRLSALDYYLQAGDAQELARFLRQGRTHWLTRDTDEQFPIHTYSPDGVRKLVEAAGFEVVDLVGKTVLPMRQYRHLLEDAAARRRWASVEKSLCRNSDAMGRASHIQVVGRVGEERMKDKG